jgi:GH43 family beta-xylosidase
MRRDRRARSRCRLGIERLEPRLTLSGNGLTAQYFHNMDFTGLAETRTEAVAFRWGAGSPAVGVDPDTFSVRWTGQIEPQFSQAYRFSLNSDQFARVWLDGQLVLDAWSGPVRSLQSAAIPLVAGQRYDLRVDYAENVDTAFIELSWSSASQPLELIPADRLYESPAGILGTYSDLQGTNVRRVDPGVDYNYGPRAPVDLTSDDFSIVWSGQLQADYSETYSFSTISDERVRLWIGNELVIENWGDHTTTEDIGTKWLEAGKLYDVRLEYYDVQGNAEIHWRWASEHQTGGAFEVVPTDNLRAIKPALKTFQNPLGKGADPFVTRYGDYYYLTMTSGSNVSIHRAKALEDIHPDDAASDSLLVWDPPNNTPYGHDVWAPELHQLNGKWYIYVTASDGADANHRMYVLERDAADPFGPYVFKGEIQVPTDLWAIDGTVLQWQGKTYFIWSGWPTSSGGRQNLYIAEMSNPWTIIGDRSLLSTPTFSWEMHGLPINEGPEVLIHDGQLHIIYSASGFWTYDYALGRLTYKGTGSLLDRNSWTKASAPVFKKTTEVEGTGHASFTVSPGGDEHWIVYHARPILTDPNAPAAPRDVRIQPFTFNADGTPNFGAPLPPTTVLPVPSNGADAERPMLAGDYNASGAVDLVDLSTWRATFGKDVFANSAADGSGNGVVDAADYVLARHKLETEQLSQSMRVTDLAGRPSKNSADNTEGQTADLPTNPIEMPYKITTATAPLMSKPKFDDSTSARAALNSQPHKSESQLLLQAIFGVSSSKTAPAELIRIESSEHVCSSDDRGDGSGEYSHLNRGNGESIMPKNQPLSGVYRDAWVVRPLSE